MYIDRLKTLGRRCSTIESYLHAWRYVVDDTRLTHINQITVSRMEDFAERLKAKGTRAQTINLYIGVVKGALDWARDFEYIRRNPLARWEALKRDASRKRRDMTPEEIDRFFAAEKDAAYRLRWLLYFRTGLRASAGMSVEWGWVDWDRRELLLPAEHNKSRIDFWLPLDPELFEALRRCWDALSEEARRGPIFERIGIRQLRKRFHQTCVAAEIDVDGLCLHSIRHTYATMSYESSGHNVKVVQELLCHADGGTTMKYIHASTQDKRETVNRNAIRFQRQDDEELRKA